MVSLQNAQKNTVFILNLPEQSTFTTYFELYEDDVYQSMFDARVLLC